MDEDIVMRLSNDMNASDAALVFLRQGFWPTPIKPIELDDESDKQRGKKPAWKDWGLDLPTRAGLMGYFRANPRAGLGVRLGPEGGLIDIDMDNPKKGLSSLIQIFGSNGPPETLSWKTKRGQHWLYRWDDRLSKIADYKSNWNREFCGLELRIGGAGKSVAATIPPSRMIDGEPRQWVDPLAGIACLPDEAIQVILEHCVIPPPPKLKPMPAVTQDWLDRERRAFAWLATREPAVAGASGRTQFWNTVCQLKGFCVSRDELLRLTLEYNLICQPPFSDRELTDTVDRVVTVAPFAFGYKLGDSEDFARVRRKSVTLKPKAPETQSVVTVVSENETAESDLPPQEDWEATEVGNARRFVYEMKDQVRYCPAWKKWLIWDGSRYAEDVRDKATQLVIESIRKWTALADGNEDRVYGGWYRDSQSRAKIESTLRLARAMPGVGIDSNDLDTDPWIINTLSGILDLKTGTLSPHDPAKLCSRLAPVSYDPEAKSEPWETFLRQISCERSAVVEYLQKVGGYSITGITTEQQFWTFWGSGRNGKGVLLELWLDVLGDYATTTSADLFLVKTTPQHTTSLSELQNRRFVFTDEINSGGQLDEGQMKRLTGGLEIAARRMRTDEFRFKPLCKVFLLTNEKPAIYGTDPAIWERLRLVDFPVLFVDPEVRTPSPPHVLPKILGLAEKLKTTERAAIFNWLVRGCLQWQKSSLASPPEVSQIVIDYRNEQDQVGQFISQCCAITPDESVGGAEIYKKYRSFVTENGQKPLGNPRFSQEMSRLGFVRKRVHGHSFWFGLSISTSF